MGRWENKYVIGLTGNIATGKSVVRRMLQHLGAFTIDADHLTHQAMQRGAPAYKPIVEKFGMFILDADKQIDRKALGNLVFSNPSALAELEAIVHPIVRQAVNTLVKRARQRVVVVEAIKLIEGELGQWVDTVWVVDASPSTQLARLTKDGKMSDADANTRMKAQNPQSEKIAKADVVIKNDGSVEETWKQVQEAWEDVKRAVIAMVQAGGTPQPAATPGPTTAAPSADGDRRQSVKAGSVEAKRGAPSNAQAIAEFISKHSGQPVSRMDVMMSFGQKSYLLAEAGEGNVVSVLGWQIENLITRADEFYIEAGVPTSDVIKALVDLLEVASEDLQSEVGFIFLPHATPSETVKAFMQYDYQMTGIRDIKVPAWREAVQETLSEHENMQILMKKLREDRVLKPI